VVREPEERGLDVLASAEVPAGKVDAPAERPGPVGIRGDVDGVLGLASQVADREREDPERSGLWANVERLLEGPGSALRLLDRSGAGLPARPRFARHGVATSSGDMGATADRAR